MTTELEIRYSIDQPNDPDQPRRHATHGNYSTQFHGRIRHALNIAPDLTAHILSMRTARGTAGEKVHTSTDPAAPLNVTAVDDADHLMQFLTYWAIEYADRLAVRPPRTGTGRRVNGAIEGFNANTRPDEAHDRIRVLTTWHLLWLEQILTLPHADVEPFATEIQTIWQLNARWPMEEKPRYSQLPCPDDRHARDESIGRIAMYPPRAHGDDLIIKCEGCGRYFEADQYAHLIEVFAQQAEERRREKISATKSRRIASDLAAKYAS